MFNKFGNHGFSFNFHDILGTNSLMHIWFYLKFKFHFLQAHDNLVACIATHYQATWSMHFFYIDLKCYILSKKVAFHFQLRLTIETETDIMCILCQILILVSHFSFKQRMAEMKKRGEEEKQREMAFFVSDTFFLNPY